MLSSSVIRAVRVSRAASMQAARSYYTSGSSNDNSYGYTAYTCVESYATATPAASASFSQSPSAAIGCPNSSNNVAPLECMNRNARKPTRANHGARPNSNYNRKSSSPEFGSWRHPGLRPGQSPPPRPQPGTPIVIASVGVQNGTAAPKGR